MTATQLQFRRGNTAQHSTFTGASAEVTVDTDKKVVVVHDGVNAGGTPLATGAFAQAAFNQANTAVSSGSTNLTYIAGVDATQNTNITAVNTYAASAYGQANTNSGSITVIQGVDNTQNTNITAVNTYATSAYGQANTGVTLAQAAFDAANNVFPQIQPAYNKANGAYDQANTATTLAQASFNTANTNTTNIGYVNTYAESAYGLANTNSTNISTTDTKAQAAFDRANTKFSSSGGSITGDTSITGNLTVTGTTFYANTVNMNVEDNIITLNSNVTGAPTLSAGIEVNRGSSTNTKLLWVESDSSWQFTNDGTNYNKIPSQQFANSAFDKANTNASDITVIQGINTTQNTNITAVNTYAAGAYGAANTNTTNIGYVNTYAASSYAQANTNATNITVMQGVNTTQNTNITVADTKAQAAFDKANSGIKTTTSATKPTSNNAGDLWYSTGDDTLYQYTYDGTSNNWVDISGPILRSSDILVQYTITANVS